MWLHLGVFSHLLLFGKKMYIFLTFPKAFYFVKYQFCLLKLKIKHRNQKEGINNKIWVRVTSSLSL